MTGSSFVLVVDSDIDRMNERVQQLRLDGRAAEGAANLDRARTLLASADTLVLAEVPGGPADTLRLLRDVRGGALEGVASDVPTLTFADSDGALMSAFRAGTDLTLPTNASGGLVSASVEALTQRRERQAASGVVRLGKLQLDTRMRNASVDGEEVALSPRQFELLEALAKTPGKVCSRDELSQELWGTKEVRGSRAIDVQLNRLSHRLSDAGASRVIENVWGRGFRLNTEGAER
jgi:DNA-binding response OmpR family regulator